MELLIWKNIPENLWQYSSEELQKRKQIFEFFKGRNCSAQVLYQLLKQEKLPFNIEELESLFSFENEVTQLAEPTEQEIRQMREEIEEAKKEKSRAYHRNYSREYRAKNLEKQREYDRMKAREYRARRKAQAAAAQPTQ